MAGIGVGSPYLEVPNSVKDGLRDARICRPPGIHDAKVTLAFESLDSGHTIEAGSLWQVVETPKSDGLRRLIDRRIIDDFLIKYISVRLVHHCTGGTGVRLV